MATLKKIYAPTTTPGFVLPLFAERENDNRLLIQILGEGEIVTGFNIAENLDKLVDFDSPEIVVAPDDAAIWAFQREDASYIVGNRRIICPLLEEILNCGGLKNFPLAQEEAAYFVDAPEQYEKHVRQAYLSLKRKSERAASVWRDTEIMLPMAKKRVLALDPQAGIENLSKVWVSSKSTRVTVIVPENFTRYSQRIREFIAPIARAVGVRTINIVPHKEPRRALPFGQWQLMNPTNVDFTFTHTRLGEALANAYSHPNNTSGRPPPPNPWLVRCVVCPPSPMAAQAIRKQKAALGHSDLNVLVIVPERRSELRKFLEIFRSNNSSFGIKFDLVFLAPEILGEYMNFKDRSAILSKWIEDSVSFSIDLIGHSLWQKYRDVIALSQSMGAAMTISRKIETEGSITSQIRHMLTDLISMIGAAENPALIIAIVPSLHSGLDRIIQFQIGNRSISVVTIGSTMPSERRYMKIAAFGVIDTKK